MSGFAIGKKLPAARFEPPRRHVEDPCDLQFRTDLVGVRPSIANVQVGHTLTVSLIELRGARSVVCTTADGQPVGALAAFRGLAQLMRCLAQNQRYVAGVEAVSRSQCTVLVRREAA